MNPNVLRECANHLFDKYYQLPTVLQYKRALTQQANTQLSVEAHQTMWVAFYEHIKNAKTSHEQNIKILDEQLQFMRRCFELENNTAAHFCKTVLQEQTKFIETPQGILDLNQQLAILLPPPAPYQMTTVVAPEKERLLKLLKFFSKECLSPKYTVADQVCMNVHPSYMTQCNHVLSRHYMERMSPIQTILLQKSQLFGDSLLKTLEYFGVNEPSDLNWVFSSVDFSFQPFEPAIEGSLVTVKPVWQNVMAEMFNQIRTPFMLLFPISFMFMYLCGGSLISKVPLFLSNYPMIKLFVICALIFFLTYVGLKQYAKMILENQSGYHKAALNIQNQLITALNAKMGMDKSLKEQSEAFKKMLEQRLLAKFELYKSKVIPSMVEKAKRMVETMKTEKQMLALHEACLNDLKLIFKHLSQN